jgi:drug/metabolite transporter superfamily protein YnfA
LVDKIKNEMGGAYGTYGGVEVYTVFWWGNLLERCYLEDLGIDGMIVLKWIFKRKDRGVY